MIVVDASVAVKWFIAEPDSERGEKVLGQHLGKIIVPDLFMIEVNAALVRKSNANKNLAARGRVHIANFATMAAAQDFAPVRLAPDRLQQATEMALDLGHPLKDCIYLVLAIEHDCPLVTADARFAAKARRVFAHVQVLEDWPV